MESALTISPPWAFAMARARADLPLAVGPAMSQTLPMHFSLTLVSPGAEPRAKLRYTPDARAISLSVDSRVDVTTALADGGVVERTLGPMSTPLSGAASTNGMQVEFGPSGPGEGLDGGLDPETAPSCPASRTPARWPKA